MLSVKWCWKIYTAIHLMWSHNLKYQIELILKIVFLLFLFTVNSVADAPVSKQSIKPVSQIKKANEFTLLNIEEELEEFKAYQGKVVAVNFWATWCPPCREELPSMQDTFLDYEDQEFTILGVNVGENWETVASFLSDYDIDFPILLDDESEVMMDWQAYGLPTTFIVNRNGEITHRIDGGRDWNHPEFRSQLQNILKNQ